MTSSSQEPLVTSLAASNATRPATSSGLGSSANSRSTMVQLKSELRGQSFDVQMARLAPVQARGGGGQGNGPAADTAAANGGGGASLAHLDRIQSAFGQHDSAPRAVQRDQGSSAPPEVAGPATAGPPTAGTEAGADPLAEVRALTAQIDADDASMGPASLEASTPHQAPAPTPGGTAPGAHGTGDSGVSGARITAALEALYQEGLPVAKTKLATKIAAEADPGKKAKLQAQRDSLDEGGKHYKTVFVQVYGGAGCDKFTRALMTRAGAKDAAQIATPKAGANRSKWSAEHRGKTLIEIAAAGLPTGTAIHVKARSEDPTGPKDAFHHWYTVSGPGKLTDILSGEQSGKKADDAMAGWVNSAVKSADYVELCTQLGIAHPAKAKADAAKKKREAAAKKKADRAAGAAGSPASAPPSPAPPTEAEPASDAPAGPGIALGTDAAKALLRVKVTETRTFGSA